MKKKIGLIAIAFILLLSSARLYPQQITDSPVRQLTLEQAIELAREQSPDALIARHRFLSSYWEYRSYIAQFMPKLSLSATLPSINKSVSSYTLPDGTETFVRRQYTSYSGDLALSKIVGITGGSIYMRSRLQHLQNSLDTTGQGSWLSNPVTIGFNQPLFSYNPYRWSRKIDPLKYIEAGRRYVEEMEQVAITATTYFFNLLTAQGQLQIAEVNLANYDTLYRIARGRYNMGTIAENELLQLELNLLRSKSEAENARLEVENAMFRLRSFLRIKNNEQIELVAPADIRFAEVGATEAIQLARENRSSSLGFERRLLESRRDVDQARHQGRFEANLALEYGLSRDASKLSDVYRNPNDMQQLSLSLYVPILDWGQARGRIKMAESNRELVKTSVEQELIDFDQEVYLAVMQYNIQKNQLYIAAKSDTVAAKSYLVAKARYMIGKISITDLNIAQAEKDQARMSYLRALQKYWTNWYNLRRITHFDFIENKLISPDLNKIIQ
ncbi:MAG: TolC family protein [Bacteroidales bacterium]